MDAEIKNTFAEKPDALSKIPPFKPGAGRNIAFCASPVAKDFVFLGLPSRFIHFYWE